MERLDKLLVYETDKGNYAVRPFNWAGIWNADGKIKECGLNHTAVFHYKEDAEWYAETKNAEEQGLLLRLPCKVGDKAWYVHKGGIDEVEVDSFIVNVNLFVNVSLYIGCDRFGKILTPYKTLFFTKEEAEQALEEMKGV